MSMEYSTINDYELWTLTLPRGKPYEIRQKPSVSEGDIRQIFVEIPFADHQPKGVCNFILPHGEKLKLLPVDMGDRFREQHQHNGSSVRGTREEIIAELRQSLKHQGMTDFNLLSEYGDTLLAARQLKNGDLEFVTWEYDHGRSEVHYGNYFGSNHKAAKIDFTVRAGLMDRNRVFTEAELAVLYDSCVFRGRNDGSITYDDERKLRPVIEMLEDIRPEHDPVRSDDKTGKKALSRK